MTAPAGSIQSASGGPLARFRLAAVVVLRDSWRERGYDRLARFPELGALLARDYALAVQGDDYRIYAKRSGS